MRQTFRLTRLDVFVLTAAMLTGVRTAAAQSEESEPAPAPGKFEAEPLPPRRSRSANLPQQERVLSPFFVSRNVGAKLSHVFGAKQRMTFSTGVFNGWRARGESFSSSGTDVAVRLIGLPCDLRDGRRFLHLAASGRHAGDRDKECGAY